MSKNRDRGKRSRLSCGSSPSQHKRLGIAFVRANNYDCTPAIPRALEASRSIFSRVHILCWNRSGKNEPKDVSIKGVSIKQFMHAAPQRSLRVVLLTLWYQGWLFWNLLRIKSNVIQVCSIVSGLPAGMVALLTRRRLIYDMRDPFVLCYRLTGIIRQIAYTIDWCVMGLSSAFVVPTLRYIPYMKRWGISKREVFEIPNTCHDLLYTLPSAKNIVAPKGAGIIRLCYMGYLDVSRGGQWLLNFCRDDSHQAELVVAGDCRSPALKAELQSTPNVIYCGRLPYDSALSVMRQADAVTIFLDPDVYPIGDPTKFYEAMMVGTPVLVSKGASVANLVSENGVGYTVEYNSMSGLRDVVEKLRDSERTGRMRLSCRQYYLENLRLSKELTHYRQFYSRMREQWFPAKG